MDKKYIVIWRQTYDITEILAIIDEDKLDDFIKSYVPIEQSEKQKYDSELLITELIQTESGINYLTNKYEKKQFYLFNYDIMVVNKF